MHPNVRRDKKYRSEFHLPPCPCTNCGKMNDAASKVIGSNQPRPGCYSICFNCHHLMMYDENMMLRNPTDEEIVAIAGDKQFVRMMKALAEVKKEKEKHDFKRRRYREPPRDEYQMPSWEEFAKAVEGAFASPAKEQDDEHTRGHRRGDRGRDGESDDRSGAQGDGQAQDRR